MSLGTGSLGSGSLGSGGAGVLAPPPFIPPAPPVVLEIWPVGLPQIPLRDGYVETEPNVIKRTDMDEGPAKQRPRFTVGIRPFLVQLEMDLDQVAIFETFYEDTLKDGTLPFTWKHPRTQVNTDFYIRQTQKVKMQGARNYRVTMALEVMP
mgnify:FL=1